HVVHRGQLSCRCPLARRLFRSPPPPTSTLLPYTTLFRSHRLDDPSGQVVGDRLHEPLPLGVVEDLADQRSGLGEVVVLGVQGVRSEEHTSELQSRENLVCRLLLEKKKRHERGGRQGTRTG